MARHFVFLALSRARCTSANCSLPFGTTALYLPMLKFILRLCSRSAALTAVLAINVFDCSDIVFFWLPTFVPKASADCDAPFNSGNFYHLLLKAKVESNF